MVTNLLNAGEEIATIQYLLGHKRITTTMQYARLSNLKAQKDYYQATDKVIEESGGTLSWNMRC